VTALSTTSWGLRGLGEWESVRELAGRRRFSAARVGAGTRIPNVRESCNPLPRYTHPNSNSTVTKRVAGRGATAQMARLSQGTTPRRHSTGTDGSG
jgi:hypothetical protein